MMDKLFHGFFVRKNTWIPPVICAMNLKVFNFREKFGSAIVDIDKNIT